ncbi:MAG: metalloregulator ArsR/SmtB family transcription factor [Caldisericota bacterium]|nr:metalloregulator ArsR/SmtB family transcription factor [Caldisericota bacterium]
MKTKKELYKDLKTCRELSEFITALGNPGRVAIVCFLKDEPKNVSTISKTLNIPQSSVSIHLNNLRHMGWVKKEKNGREVFYAISDKKIISLLEDLSRQFLIIKEGR